MDIVLGFVIVLVSLPCWGGQAISLIAPSLAERWKLTESEPSVDAVFYGDVRGEALWDTFTLWTMPLAGGLLIASIDAWATIGLVAGGMYLYFGGRGILARRAIVQRGGRVGDRSDVNAAYAALAAWGLLGFAVIVGAATELAR